MIGGYHGLLGYALRTVSLQAIFLSLCPAREPLDITGIIP